MRTTTTSVVLVACALALAACRPTQSTADTVSQAGDNPPSPSATDATSTARDAPPPLAFSNGRLTDASGRSVYVLAGNTDGGKCDAACENAWPPVLIDAAVGNVAGIQAGLLGTRTRADGSLQATYDSQPLYRYAGDGSADSTSGDGVRDQWGEWHLARSDAADAATPAEPAQPASPPASQSPPPSY